MKTQIVLIILFQVFFAGSIFSQYKLESKLNLPRPGDEILKQQVTYKDPGRSGVNVLWDFSALGNDSKPYTLTYDTIDGILTGIEHRTRYYYRIWNDSLFVDGYENATTLMQYSQPELVRKFPVAFGDSLFSYFRGEGHYCDRLKVDVMGTLASSADSYGMMILPDKDTLKHVLRIKTVKRTVEDLKPLSFNIFQEDTLLPSVVPSDSILYRLATDSLVMEVETYSWYAEGYRYPVFETVKSRNIISHKPEDYFATAFFYPPREHEYLESDPLNKKIVEDNKGKEDNPLAGCTFNVFPNPADYILNVEIYLPVEAKIEIQMRPVVTKNVCINENKGKFKPGIHSFQLNVSKLPQGYYLLNIRADNYLLSETILKL